MTKSGRVAVFSAPQQPFTIEQRSMPDPGPGAVVVKVSACNICGSDLHAWHGKFKTTALGGQLPTVLGHEMVGSIAALGEGVTHDSNGLPLKTGDRVAYTYFTSCGTCPSCLRGHRVACSNVKIAMTGSVNQWPHFVGGYADYFYVHPGSTIYKVPEEIPDELAAGANCALSQVIYGFQRANLRFGEVVVVQGAGGLGLYATAVAKAAGAAKVIVLDAVDDRLDLARRFGADHTVNINAFPEFKARLKEVKRLTGERGADVVMELAGRPEVIPDGIAMTAMMGRYVLIGNINSGLTYAADPSRLVFGNKTLIGVSLYEPNVLGLALQFLQAHKGKLPFEQLLSRKYPLEQIDDAFLASEKREVTRASIVM